MGFYNIIGLCAGCGRMVCFHPDKVPSFKGQPLCKSCMDRVNRARIDKELQPIPILPDAYTGVFDEENDSINWGD